MDKLDDLLGIEPKEYTLEQVVLVKKVINKLSMYYRTFGSTFADLQQEGWIGYLKGVKTFKPEIGTTFTYWVISYICWSLCALLNRESKQRHIKHYENLSEYIEVQEDHADDVIERVAVLNCLQELTERQRILAENRFILGLTQTETAVILNCTQGAISSLERQTLAVLKSLLSDPGKKRKDLIPTLKGGRLKNKEK